MTRRYSALAEPEDAFWRVYRIWRECRKLEGAGRPPAFVATAFYERVSELFDEGHASAADTQQIDDVDALTTTTPPPATV